MWCLPDVHEDCPPLCSMIWNPQKIEVILCVLQSCCIPILSLESWHIWAGLCQAGRSSRMAWLTGRRVDEYPACFTLNEDIKAILCCCFSFLRPQPTYKTKTYSHTHQPRTLPSLALSLKVFFLPVSLCSAMSEWVAVSVGGVAIILKECVCLCPWLTFPFFLSFSLSSLVLVPARPLLCNSVLLFLSAIQRCTIQKAHN